jgi:diacylglycerol kinase family enzyme
MKYFIISNPHARGGKGAVSARRCLDLLARDGRDMEHAEVKHFDDAYALSRQANLAGYGAIVAIGGDGTINKVLNGFYDETGARISDALFGVVHTGTSPDFCRSYDVPLDVDGAVRALAARRTRRIPVGMIRFHPGANGELSRADAATGAVSYFVCCANIGLGASLAARANAGIRKRVGDTLGTFYSLLQVLRTYEPEDFRLLVDDEEIAIGEVYNISVGLTPYIASGIKVANEEYRDAGMFYMMTMRAVGAGNFLPMLRRIYSGRKFADTEYLSVRGCRSVSFPRLNRRSDVEHDGDPCGHLPCTIEMAKEELDLIY